MDTPDGLQAHAKQAPSSRRHQGQGHDGAEGTLRGAPAKMSIHLFIYDSEFDALIPSVPRYPRTLVQDMRTDVTTLHRLLFAG
jgi:hypothetical protein